MAKSNKSFTFDDLNSELAALNPMGSVMELSDFSEITEYIDTGNYHLNACVSGSLFKGWPNNRAVSVAGPSGTGKTFLMLNTVREAINMGYSVIYYDSEAAIDKELMKKFGIDISKVNYQPVNTVQEFRTSVTTITKKMQDAKRNGAELPKVMILLDSAGNLATQKEIDDAANGSDKADMTRSKVLKSIFRIIMTPLADLKIPFLFTNHTYLSQDFMPVHVAGGGTGPEYAASIVLMLTKAQLKDGAERVGIIVTAKPAKNRFAKPHPIKFHLDFSKGMNRYVGLEQYATWDICGVARGTIDPKTKEKVLKDTARTWVCKHLDTTVTNAEFFTEKVFTKEVLQQIDEYIKPIFNYNTDVNDFTIDDIIDEEE